MNKFLIVMGGILILGGLFELSQGRGDWWVRSLQGSAIGLAGFAMQKRQAS
jgi:hypothetical protein